VLLLLLLVVLRGVLSHPARQKLAALDTWTGGVRTHPGREEDGVFPGTGGEKRRRAYAERGAARQKGRREEGRWSAAGDREAKGIAIYASLSLSALPLLPASLLMCCAFAFYLAGSVSFPVSRSLWAVPVLPTTSRSRAAAVRGCEIPLATT